MKKLIGWIELILGIVLIITPLIVMGIVIQFSAEVVINPDPIVPEVIASSLEHASATLQIVIEVLAAAYLLIIFLIGLLMTLEGLAKVKN